MRELRRIAYGAQQQLREELGPEFNDVDWRKLDPRQYDPRRIIRDALADDGSTSAVIPVSAAAPARARADQFRSAERQAADSAAPFDADAT